MSDNELNDTVTNITAEDITAAMTTVSRCAVFYRFLTTGDAETAAAVLMAIHEAGGGPAVAQALATLDAVFG